MKKNEEPPQSKMEQEKKVKALVKFSTGDYGVGKNTPTPAEFLPKAIIQEGLEEAYLSSNQ
jgi:hypothetical protein